MYTCKLRHYAMPPSIRFGRALKIVDDDVVALARHCGGEGPSDSSRCPCDQHHHAIAYCPWAPNCRRKLL
jgi:hypothetical protein